MPRITCRIAKTDPYEGQLEPTERLFFEVDAAHHDWLKQAFPDFRIAPVVVDSSSILFMAHAGKGSMYLSLGQRGPKGEELIYHSRWTGHSHPIVKQIGVAFGHMEAEADLDIEHGELTVQLPALEERLLNPPHRRSAPVSGYTRKSGPRAHGPNGDIAPAVGYVPPLPPKAVSPSQLKVEVVVTCDEDGGMRKLYFDEEQIKSLRRGSLPRWDQWAIRKWQKDTFPIPTLLAAATRLNKEVAEILSLLAHSEPTPEMLLKLRMECADLHVFNCQLSDLAGGDLLEDADTKMDVNVERQWAKAEDGSFQHVEKSDVVETAALGAGDCPQDDQRHCRDVDQADQHAGAAC